MRALLAVLLFLGGDDFAAGVRAYREGRYQDALEAFTAAELAAGDGASAELLYDRALSALRAGQLRVAEFSAEKAAVRGGPEFRGLRDFLLGNAAFARCARAEAEAGLAEADPTVFARAIARAADARDAWQRAAASRVDWPEARRNVERALRKLEELREKQREAEQQRAAKREQRPEAEPNPDADAADPAGDPEEIEHRPAPQADPDALTREQLLRLLGKLDETERQKRALRRARQQVLQRTVEKDW